MKQGCYNQKFPYGFLALFYSEFPVILLSYAPISMHFSQNYSQDHCQNNPGALKILLYCKHDYSIGVIIIIHPLKYVCQSTFNQLLRNLDVC